ncbi:MAG TPA: glycosyltransferase [Verrucomicrobiae bacterium]|nr:glycosyltransferase [Verrucomicrobiae bacterium]
MNYANAILAALALLSFALVFWQWLAARKFPLHRRTAESGFTPAISLLKPLKGCDDTTADSLRSWFNQKYSGPIQILFGVADANDPVCEIVRQIIAENPNGDARLLICENLPGANAKVAKLAQLEKLAKHDLLLISDADVRVPPDFLVNVAAPFDERSVDNPLPATGTHGVTRPAVGLVNCFYRLANPSTTAMQWEAIAINADFWSQVLQSRSLKPLDFALGAVMLVRRETLNEIGGFQSLADCLADDYQLGHRIAAKGHHIALCPVVVECWDPPMNWREVWKHQLRWARTIRVCQPLPYFFSVLSNATVWPLLWLVSEFGDWMSLNAAGTQAGSFQFFETRILLLDGMILALALLLARIALARDLQHRLTPGRGLISPFWLVPAKDLLQAVVWFCAFAGNTVEWRGRKMKLRRDGTLEVGGR